MVEECYLLIPTRVEIEIEGQKGGARDSEYSVGIHEKRRHCLTGKTVLSPNAELVISSRYSNAQDQVG